MATIRNSRQFQHYFYLHSYGPYKRRQQLTRRADRTFLPDILPSHIRNQPPLYYSTVPLLTVSEYYACGYKAVSGKDGFFLQFRLSHWVLSYILDYIPLFRFFSFDFPNIQGDTKKRELLKTPQKIEKIQEKILLTEIEPLHLAF